MKITNIHDAKINLSKLIDSVLQGEDVVISKAGKPLVKLVPYTPHPEPRNPGYWKGKVKMASDFDHLPDEIIKRFLDK